MRSITGVETGMDVNTATQHQLEAIPGIGPKGAWRLVSARARASNKRGFDSVEKAFEAAGLGLPDAAKMILVADAASVAAQQ